MKTAVEWLIEEIKAEDWWYLPQSMKQDIFEQAKQMEKEQNDKSYQQGEDDAWELFYQMNKPD